MNPFFSRGAIGAAAALLAGSALAQAEVTLKPVTVTGNPLGSDLVAPASQLSGTGLLLRSQSTLGETLNQLPGVSSTYFGPNASRPVIRGLDGDRVRILNNSGAALDVSNLSYDHAVAADPITIERIEVLRGPGALLYGGNALGGAVNLIDNRIPREPLQGVGGKADLGFASASRERGGGLSVDGGNGRVVLHADAFNRSASDTRVPIDLACEQGGVVRFARRICNSAGRTHGGALGGSLFFDQGYLGASASTYRNDYGAVAEDEVTIGMEADRYALEGEWRNPTGALALLKGQFSHSDYRHTEFDAGAPGTLFKNRGSDLRLEARHRRLGPLEGAIGLQADSTRFSADGEEAFAPYSRTRQTALFVYEEAALDGGKLTFGARREQVQVESLGHPELTHFEPASRRFSPTSLALGGQWKLGPQWQLTGQLARSERAPKDYELYADGPHVATGAWEVGNSNLGKERAHQVDLGLQWDSGANHFKLNGFASRFANYIALQRTGAERELDGEALRELAYQAVRARFQGLEASGTARLLEGASTVDLELRAELVRARNADTGEPLPRIAPRRAGATLAWTRGHWSARLGFDNYARQSRVPSGEVPVAGYTLWNAALTWRMPASGASLLWYARLDNASNRLAYSATSILTQTAPGKVPLPGRSVKVGVQATF